MPVFYTWTRAVAIRVAVLALVIFSALSVLSHRALAGPGGDGHSHGEEAAPATGSLSHRVPLRGEVYDAVAIYKNGRITLYLDLLSDNSPAAQANVDLTLGHFSGPLTADVGGTFSMQVNGLAPGAHEVIASVTGPAGEDLLAGTLQIGASAAPEHGLPGSPVSPMHQLADRFFHLAERPGYFAFGAGLVAGLLVAIMMAFGRRKSAALAAGVIIMIVLVGPSIAGPGGDGHSHGEEGSTPLASDAPHRLPDGTVFLPKPAQRLLGIRTARTEVREVASMTTLPARVIASPHHSGVVQSVNGGRLLMTGYRLPVLGQRVVKGQLLGLVEPPINAADESTIRDRANEIAQQIILAELRLQRLAALAAKNAAPATQVSDLEAEIESLKRRRAELRLRREPEELRAPIDGTVAAVSIVAGQVIAPQFELFRIVDPTSMWLEAVSFSGFKAPDADGMLEANGMIEGLKPLVLKLEGVGPVLQSHATKLMFSMHGASDSLMEGQTAKVLVKSAETFKGVTVPREAVVRASNGQSMVWSHTSPERFTPVFVRGEPLDASQYAVRAGLDAGLNVVTRGAELLNQVR